MLQSSKDFGCIIFTCLSMELMDGGVLISPDSACLILNDVLEGSVGALDGWEIVLFWWEGVAEMN